MVSNSSSHINNNSRETLLNSTVHDHENNYANRNVDIATMCSFHSPKIWNVFTIWFALFVYLVTMIHSCTRTLYFSILETNINFVINMNISGSIRLIQWNCCGIRGKLPQLQIIANEVDIMCIQESNAMVTQQLLVERI